MPVDMMSSTTRLNDEAPRLRGPGIGKRLTPPDSCKQSLQYESQVSTSFTRFPIRDGRSNAGIRIGWRVTRGCSKARWPRRIRDWGREPGKPESETGVPHPTDWLRRAGQFTFPDVGIVDCTPNL